MDSVWLQNHPAPFYSFKYMRLNIIIPLTIKIWFLSSGRKVRLRHLRSGYEFPPISEDNNYDYSAEEYLRLQKTVTVHPVSSYDLCFLKIYCVGWCYMGVHYFIFFIWFRNCTLCAVLLSKSSQSTTDILYAAEVCIERFCRVLTRTRN
jgi:hypothetical protein